MTATLLAHSDLFQAGVARSGAYNRTLTPFGFQSERRTLWQARDSYINMSPLMHAHQIDEPLLLIHGATDNNAGTFPMQSERMYQAVRGNGGTVRLVMLPHEAHNYRGRESVEHTLYEMVAWFDRYVKNAPLGRSRSLRAVRTLFQLSARNARWLHGIWRPQPRSATRSCAFSVRLAAVGACGVLALSSC
jgi:hypothetical protein